MSWILKPVEIIAFARDTLGDMTGPAMWKGRLGNYGRWRSLDSTRRDRHREI